MSVRAPSTTRDFAALALTVLLERMGATARDLSSVRPEGRADAQVASTPRAPSLAQASMELERQGWLFGMLARELGCDVLFERRERRGLEYALWLVDAILQREGIQLAIPAVAALPELDTGDEHGTTICAALARCVHAAHVEDAAAHWCFERSGAGTALCFESRPGALLESALCDAQLRVAGSRLVREPQGARWLLPVGSLALL